MSSDVIFVKTALTAWEQWLSRATKSLAELTDEQLFTEVAPGKNRAIYIVGHLIAVHDSMLPQLRLGDALYPDLRETFIVQPDRLVAKLPSPAELRDAWAAVHGKLAEQFARLEPVQWLERHSSVSEEDFAREPQRNRLAILLSRTAHLGYHMGQLRLMPR